MRSVRSPARPVFSAWLGSDVPSVLKVGGGDVLLLEGYFDAADAVRRMTVSAGGLRADALIHSVAPPGETVGCDWWSALLPISATDGEREVEITAHALLEDGREAGAPLARTRLMPAPEAAPVRPHDELVAVCMATYNPDPELFRAQVDSIRAQDHSDWVCIVSDDASAPQAWDELSRVVGRDKRFTCLRNESRAGFYRNFERALEAVPPAARYVALADQDDRWHPDKLSSLIAGLGHSSVLVHSDARIVDARGGLIAPTFWPDGTPGTDRLEDLVFASSVTGASCLFRRSVLEHALPFPRLAGNPFHDRWLALVSTGMGSVDRVDRPLYDYVQHGRSVLGHSRAVGLARLEDRSRVAALAGRIRRLRSKRPNWREAHDSVLARSVSEAIVLRLRLGEAMTARAKRAVEAVERLPRSRSSVLRVAARHAVRAPRRAPGLEGALLRGVAWQMLARRRGRKSRRLMVETDRRRGQGPRTSRRRHDGPTRVGITVTDASAHAGFGDFYTASELASALTGMGHDVVLLELFEERWLDSIDEVDVLISLHDRLVLTQVPDRVATAAWVRNWTDRWIGRPWFSAYDALFATSRLSAERIEARTGRSAVVMPLATNPDRFKPGPGQPELRSDVMFAGNYWGGKRLVADVLPRIAPALDVKIFGANWSEVPEVAGLSYGPLAYDDLPSAYASSALVVDDSAPHTLPYGAVNSRVFDALACGVPVASNDEAGVRAIFGDDFPIWHDAMSLEALACEAVGDPKRLQSLAQRLRDEVLERHTYAHRARQFDALLSLRGD